MRLSRVQDATTGRLQPIGYIPPAEAEANYWQQQRAMNSGGPPAAPAGRVEKGVSNSRSQQTNPV